MVWMNWCLEAGQQIQQPKWNVWNYDARPTPNTNCINCFHCQCNTVWRRMHTFIWHQHVNLEVTNQRRIKLQKQCSCYCLQLISHLIGCHLHFINIPEKVRLHFSYLHCKGWTKFSLKYNLSLVVGYQPFVAQCEQYICSSWEKQKEITRNN